MIRFLDPAFLAGLAAVAVPIVLHLFLRRRVPVVVFPLVRLLERAERTRQPRRRLNRILLLLARTLLLALLALALARVTIGSGAVAASAGPEAVVVVMDDSLSMGAVDDDGRTAFEEGREAADAVLAGLSEGSLSAVLAASRPEAGEAAGLAPEADAARRDLARLELTARHVRLGPALRAALRLLATSPLPDRRVVLVSDIARHGFADLDLATIDGAPPRLDVVATKPRDRRTNQSVAGVTLGILPDGRLGVAARVAAWGGAAEDVPLEVRVGGALGPLVAADRAKVSTRGGASTERRFDLATPAEGYVAVEVAVAGGDPLPADDVRAAVEHAARRPRLLVVDGDPQNVSLGSESFYLDAALARDVGLDFEAEVLPLPELRPRDLVDRDVVVLCNAPEVGEERAQALEAAVRGGTGLLVALGNRVDARSYNGRLEGMLPATLSLPRELEAPLAVEVASGLPALPRVTVRQHVTLVPDAGATVLARLADGSPLLVEGTMGEGTVLLLGTTLDRDWTDLPISPHFLAFLRDAIGRIASRQEGRVLDPVRVGAPVDLAVLAPIVATTVVGPGGRRGEPDASGVFRDTEVPGPHVVEHDGRAVAAFAVVADPVESDLARAPDEIPGLVAPALIAGSAPGADATGAAGGWPLWKALLGGLVAVALGEAWLARRAL